MLANLRQRAKRGEYVGRTIKSMILTGTQDSSRRENRPASRNSEQKEATTIEDAKGKTVETLTGTQESSEDSSFAHQKKVKPIEIDGRGNIKSVAFLVDGKHVVSGDEEGKIRHWRVEDGKEVGTPMDAGSPVCNIAVSQNGKWVVSGTASGLVTVWNAESHSKVTVWKAHNERVTAVDVSRDGTRIATGSFDWTLSVWSLSTGQRLLGPLGHDSRLAGVKFSPNGRLIATVTWDAKVRIWDSYNGSHLVEFPVKAYSALNQSLAWASDSKQLFALSRDGNVHHLDVSTGTTLFKWAIHGSDRATCIALPSNGTFIAVSAISSVSFWDTTTHEQIGTVIKQAHYIPCMAISTNYDLVTGADKTITLLQLCDILSSRYLDNVRVFCMKNSCVITFSSQSALLTVTNPLRTEFQQTKVEKADLGGSREPLQIQDDGPSTFIRSPIRISDDHVHQKKAQRILRELSKHCVSSSPTVNKRPLRGWMVSTKESSHLVQRRRVRVCPSPLSLTFR